jgi:hypothetical protein
VNYSAPLECPPQDWNEPSAAERRNEFIYSFFSTFDYFLNCPFTKLKIFLRQQKKMEFVQELVAALEQMALGLQNVPKDQQIELLSEFTIELPLSSDPDHVLRLNHILKNKGAEAVDVASFRRSLLNQSSSSEKE